LIENCSFDFSSNPYGKAIDSFVFNGITKIKNCNFQGFSTSATAVQLRMHGAQCTTKAYFENNQVHSGSILLQGLHYVIVESFVTGNFVGSGNIIVTGANTIIERNTFWSNTLQDLGLKLESNFSNTIAHVSYNTFYQKQKGILIDGNYNFGRYEVHINNNSFLNCQNGVNLIYNNVSSSYNRITECYNNLFNNISEYPINTLNYNWAQTTLPNPINIHHSFFSQGFPNNPSLLIDYETCMTGDALISIDLNLKKYSLKWNSIEKSPCIDTGYPELLDTLYNRPDMGAIECDIIPTTDYPAYTYSYTFPSNDTNNGIKWMSFPVLLDVQDNQFVNNILSEDLFTISNVLDPDILDNIEWNDLDTPVNSHSFIRYFVMDDAWSNLDHLITSKQGYKVQMESTNSQDRIIEVSGFLPPSNSIIRLYGPYNEETVENWVGYYAPKVKNVFEAFEGVIHNLYYIKGQDWAMIRDSTANGRPWLLPTTRPPTIKPGDMLIVKSFQDVDLRWDYTGVSRDPEPIPKPEQFEFVYKLDYIPIFTDFKGSELPLPKEIAVYINGVCKGAAVVTDSLAQICAYICDDLPDNPELEFMLYYDSKNQGVIPSYKVWNQAQGRFVKEKLVAQGKPDYYLVSFTKTSLEDTPLPRIQLSNYPNPFDPQTTIRYYVPKDSKVQVSIYNAKGQLVKTLVNEKKNAGMQETIWQGDDKNGTPCASGVYYCKLQYKNKNISKKLILMK